MARWAGPRPTLSAQWLSGSHWATPWAVQASDLVRPQKGLQAASLSLQKAFQPVGVRKEGRPLTTCLVQPLVRPAPEARSRVVGTPLVPTPSGGCGAQRRARAAPLGAGTGAARSHAQRPASGVSMASTARTHPLPIASTAAPLQSCRKHSKLPTAQTSSSLISDSGPRNSLISLLKMGSNRSKRAGR